MLDLVQQELPATLEELPGLVPVARQQALFQREPEEWERKTARLPLQQTDS